MAAKVTVAATLFKNLFGESAGTKALPALVALSALGHLLGVAFTVRKSPYTFSIYYERLTLGSANSARIGKGWRSAFLKPLYGEQTVSNSNLQSDTSPGRHDSLHLRSASGRCFHFHCQLVDVPDDRFAYSDHGWISQAAPY